MLRKAVTIMITIVCAACAGCQSHAKSKELVREQWRKTSAPIKLNLAQQQYERGQFDEAIKAVSESIGADPCVPEAHLLFGKLLVMRGRQTLAENELKLAVRTDENLGEGWYWLGLVTQQKCNYGEACKCFDRAISLQPRNVDYILAAAESYAAQDKCEKAVGLLEEKMESMPQEVSLKVTAADLLTRTGESERAIGLYRQAMLMSGDDGAIAESLGYCLVLSGKWDKGAAVFGRLAKEWKDSQRRKSYLEMAGLCSMNSGQYSKAADCYDKLSIEERSDAWVWVKMGQAALGAGAANRAFVCGRKALALEPGSADALALIGCAQYVSGDYQAATKSFERIATDKENGSFSWLMRARCYERLGQMSRAERAYEKALEMNPHSKLGDLLAKGR